MVILPDTDVLIDFFRGYKKAVKFINENESDIILSAIVVAELYAGVKGKKELSVLDNFISLFDVVPITSEVAKAGGLFRHNFGKSHGVGLADALIAATCVAKNAQLKTLNIKHYPMLAGLKSAYTKG